MTKYEHVDRIQPGKLGDGMHSFPDAETVYWTDGFLDAYYGNAMGRAEIAKKLGIELSDIVSFDPELHTSDVVIVDDPKGLEFIVKGQDQTLGAVGRVLGWQEPLRPMEGSESQGIESQSYDGIILVGREKFAGKHLLVSGADCTPVGIRGTLENGEEFIAVIHGGRKGTLGGITDALGKRLRFLGVITDSIQVFVGPAARSLEVPVDLLEREGGQDYSWRAGSVGEEYNDRDGVTKTRFDNLFDTVRRLVEDLGVSPGQVHVIDADTQSNPELHSYRRTKTTGRNCIVIGFSDLNR